MKKLLFVACAAFALASCGPLPLGSTVREEQARVAENAANALDFSAGNAEVANLQRRATLVAQPDLVGYVVLLSFGQPIAYYTVQGKITSSGKRLESPDQIDGPYDSRVVVDAPSYDGTYGSSDPYVFFWTTTGQYIQWGTTGGASYLYSDQPLNPNGAAGRAIVTTPTVEAPQAQ